MSKAHPVKPKNSKENEFTEIPAMNKTKANGTKITSKILLIKFCFLNTETFVFC